MKANQPQKIKDVCHRMYLYFISYEDRGTPSFGKFARSIGISHGELMKLRGHKRFDAAYRECCEIRRDYLIDRALDKRFDPSFVKYLISEEESVEGGEDDDGLFDRHMPEITTTKEQTNE